MEYCWEGGEAFGEFDPLVRKKHMPMCLLRTKQKKNSGSFVLARTLNVGPNLIPISTSFSEGIHPQSTPNKNNTTNKLI